MPNKERKAIELIDKGTKLINKAKDILKEDDTVLQLKGSRVTLVKKVRKGKYILNFSNGTTMVFYSIDD